MSKPFIYLGAGSGLFTLMAIAKGTCVCIYTGKVLRTIDAIRLEDKSYLMRLGPQVYVDPCDDKTVLGRYINDPRNKLLQNVVFDKRPDEQCAYIVAKRDIAAGEEIFADYGRWYWLRKTPTRLDKISM
jgi:SET domain-containing protein